MIHVIHRSATTEAVPGTAWFIEAWRRYLARVALYQSRALLTLAYASVVLPLGLARRLLRRPALLSDGGWSIVPAEEDSIERHERMF